MPESVALIEDLVEERPFSRRKNCHSEPKLYGNLLNVRGVADGLIRQMKPFFVTVLTVCALTLGQATGYTAASRAAARPASDEAIVHVLNRVGYGARPGEVDRVRALGIERYIDEQLRPDRIADTGVAARLAGLETVRMSSADIVSQIERPLVEARRNRKEQAADSSQPSMPPEPVQQKANSVVVELSEQKILRAVYSERQLQEVLADFWFNHFNVDARKGRDRFSSPNTSARRSGRTCWGGSAICSARRRRARRCCSTSITG